MKKISINLSNSYHIDSSSDDTFTNPVIDQDFPDPSILHASDGYFYCYATQYTDTDPNLQRNIQLTFSKDLINWEILPDPLPNKPEWAKDTQNFWAPDVKEDNGMFYMYFTAELNEGENMGIGVAIANNPKGPFIDSGKPLVFGHWIENIDPMAFDDPQTGKKLLYWGSGFKPIKVQELDDNRISFKEGSKPKRILFPNAKIECETLVEGVYLTFRNGHYYMYYSGDCCWWDRKYAVMVARSKSALGPFKKMCQEGHCADDIILGFSERWKAPGHCCIVTDDNGNDFIVYHAVDAKKRFKSGTDKLRRVMLMDKIIYKDNWPKVYYNRPSSHPQLKPVLFDKSITL